jgi:hypothetical protein
MVYNAARNELLVSTYIAPSYGIVALQPADLAPLWFLPTTSGAWPLAISDDSTQLYAGLFAESAIDQFDLNSRATVRRIRVAAANSGSGAFDIAVRPGAPDTIAVAIGSAPLIPTFSELALFTRGVRQPKDYRNPFGPRASEIEFIDADTLLGFDNETTAFSLSRFAVANDGITEGSSSLGNCCFGNSLTVAGGRAFLSRGMFVDGATLRSVKALGRGTENAIFHPGTDSVVQIFFADRQGGPFYSIQLLIEEYDYNRGYLKRRFSVDETLPGTDPRSGVTAEVLSAIPLGGSSFAMLVGDVRSGATAVLAYDLAAVAPLPSRSFDVRSVTQGGVTATAVSLPVYGYGYDPVGDRIAATVAPWVGPQGNSLAIIRASDGVVERLVPLSSEPRNVSVSPVGGMAYVSLPFENAVQAVDLGSGALVWKTRIQFPIGMPHNEVTTNGFTADSIAVKPDDAQTIVVAGCESWDNCGRILGVFRNGTQLGVYEGTALGLSRVAFNGPSEVVALDADTTSGFMTRFSMAGSTLTLTARMDGALDGGGSVNNKVGYGFAYGPYALTDIQASRRAGRFAHGSPDVPFYDQTLLMSPLEAVGHNQRLNSSVGAAAEFYELMTRSVQPDGSLLFSGQSRIRLTDERFNQGFKGIMVPMGAKRFAHGFTKFADGTGVLYLISIP